MYYMYLYIYKVCNYHLPHRHTESGGWRNTREYFKPLGGNISRRYPKEENRCEKSVTYIVQALYDTALG